MVSHPNTPPNGSELAERRVNAIKPNFLPKFKLDPQMTQERLKFGFLSENLFSDYVDLLDL